MTTIDDLTAIHQRHSTRTFRGEPIGRDLLEQVVDAGRCAPTANNRQPWHFVVVTDEAMRRRLAAITDYGKFLGQAPACIAVICDDTPYYLEDGCAATENMLVAATALGLASCWVAGDKKPYSGQVVELLGGSSQLKLVALIALGYAQKPGKPTRKRPLAELLHWEKF